MTIKSFIILITILFSSLRVLAQGHIEHIKNQDYLKLKVDCNCEIEDQLAAQICANLKFQKSDSMLVLAYNKLLDKFKREKNTLKINEVVQMQVTWRKLREEHCSILIVSKTRQEMIAYLNCLTEFTNSRTKELLDLYEKLNM